MSVSFDTSGFYKMVDGLSKISGKDFDDVLVDQVGQLMRVCIQRTHAGDRQKIEESVRFKNRNASVKSGAKMSINKDGDNVWLVDGGKKYLASKHRLPDAKWAKFLAISAILEANRIDSAVAVKSRGLTKQTWYQIAKALGPQAESQAKAPAFVKNATTFKGYQPPKLGAATRIVEGAALVIEIINASELLVKGPGPRFKGPRAKLDGRAILQGAMNTRAKAFATETKKGVFEDIAERARRYPGIFVS